MIEDALRSEQVTVLVSAAYVLWLLAVVLLLAGQYTGLPILPGVRVGVVLGTLLFVALGFFRIAQWVLRRAR